MGSLSKYERRFAGVDSMGREIYTRDGFLDGSGRQVIEALVINNESVVIEDVVVGRVFASGGGVKVTVRNARVGYLEVHDGGCEVIIGEGADVGNMPRR